MQSSISHTTQSGGYALLFVILAISVLASATASIASIAQREAFISNGVAESQRAFYAADAGIDCGLYYMRKDNLNGLPFKCMSAAGLTDENVGLTQFSFPFDFKQINSNNPSCGFITINTLASWTPVGGGGPVTGVEIQSRGYNKCTVLDTNIATNTTIWRPNYKDPTVLERRMVVRYVPGS